MTSFDFITGRRSLLPVNQAEATREAPAQISQYPARQEAALKDQVTSSAPQAVRIFFTVLVTTVVLAACATVTLISDYDEQTDKSLTTLQQATDSFFSKLLAELPKKKSNVRSEKNAYKAHERFYVDVDDQLRKIEFRVQSIPKNGKSIKLVSDIRRVLLSSENEAVQCTENGASLQDLHCMEESRSGGPTRGSLEIAQRNVNQVIGAALALELAKKQGLESNK